MSRMIARHIIFIMAICLLICMVGNLPGVSSYAQQVPSSVQTLPLDNHTGQATSQPSGNQKNETPMTDIYDIKNPEVFGMDPVLIKYISYALLGLVVITMAIILFYYFFKRKKKIAEISAYISPEDAAYSLLETLKDQTDLSYREYYFRLSAILRGYIKGRFGMDAPEMTTEELLPNVATFPVDKQMQQHVRHFLQSSDPIKFAGQSADGDKMETDFQFVRTFIQQTTPSPDVITKVSGT